MGQRKRSRTVDVGLQNDRTSNAELAQNVVTQSGAQSGPSNDSPLSDHELSEASDTSSKKQRGPTLMAHIWNQPKEKRIVVEWNKRWQPIGNEGSDLAYFVGTIARNPILCSLSYTDWRQVPKEEKKGLLEIVKSKFIIPNRPAESYVLKSMGRKWSNFKADLKLEHYESNRANVTAIMNEHRPDCVPKDQWISLVTYWISYRGKKRSVTNRKSRANQVMVHTARSKSFARVAAEKTVNGVEPSRAHVYLDTHKDRKTRPAPMDEKSKQAVDMIKEKLSELPDGKEVTNGNVAWEGDVYSQVMKEVVGEERRGRVRGLGLGSSSLASFSSTQYGEHLDDDHDQCSERMEFLEAENMRLQDKVTRLEGQQTEVLAKLKRLRALVDESMMDDATPCTSIGRRTENVMAKRSFLMDCMFSLRFSLSLSHSLQQGGCQTIGRWMLVFIL